MIMTPLQKLPNNVSDLGKIIVATGFEWLLKTQKIAISGHTAWVATLVTSHVLQSNKTKLIGVTVIA